MSWLRRVFGLSDVPTEDPVPLVRPSAELAAAKRRHQDLTRRLNAADAEIHAAMEHADQMFLPPAMIHSKAYTGPERRHR